MDGLLSVKADLEGSGNAGEQRSLEEKITWKEQGALLTNNLNGGTLGASFVLQVADDSRAVQQHSGDPHYVEPEIDDCDDATIVRKKAALHRLIIWHGRVNHR